MKKNSLPLLFILIFFLFPLKSYTQEVTPVINWQKTIGGSAADYLFALEPTPDHGYILGGHSYSDISGEHTNMSKGGDDYWIVKLDSTGGIQWQKTIGGTGEDALSAISVCPNGGYILSGTSFSGIGGDKTDASRDTVGSEPYFSGGDLWVIKLNDIGDIQWQKTYGGTWMDGVDRFLANTSYFDTIVPLFRVTQIEQTTDGGYIAGLSSTSSISGDKTEGNRSESNLLLTGFSMLFSDYWILKLDSTGAIQWQKTYGSEDNDRFSSIKQTADGGYILGGSSGSDFTYALGAAGSRDKTDTVRGNTDYWVLKLDDQGSIQWQKTIGGAEDDRLIAIDPMEDGYILGGYSNSGISGDKTDSSRGGYDYWVVKLNTTGDLTWQKTIGGGGSEMLSSIKHTNDGGYVVSGASGSNTSGEKADDGYGGATDFWVLKLNATGNIIWQKTLGGTSSNLTSTEMPATIQGTYDGGYITGGLSDASISGNKTDNSRGYYDYWVVKLLRCQADTFYRSASFCGQDSYTLPDGLIVNAPGVYASFLQNTGSCDSVIVTTLSDVTLNTNVTVAGDGLIATATAGASYQWIDCGTLLPIANAIDTSFQPSEEGYYALVVTLNNCRDTSICYAFSPTTGIADISFTTGLLIYPNPAQQYVYLQNTQGLTFKEAELMDLTGRSIMKQTLSQSGGNKSRMDISNIPSGIYLLKTGTDNNSYIGRINIIR